MTPQDPNPNEAATAAQTLAADTVPSSVAQTEADVAEPTQAVVRKGSTFESFKHRDYTWFWAGSLVSNTGTWMQNAVLAIVVWGLRGREFDLGIVNFAAGIPVLFLALPAGVLADRLDKRKLLMWSQAALGLLAAGLWILFRAGRLQSSHATEALFWIAGLGLLAGVFSALTFPAWQSFLPELVGREDLMNAIALNAAQFQSSRLLGPLAATGLLLVGFDSGDVFLVNAASFLFVIAALWAIRPAARQLTDAPAETPAEKPEPAASSRADSVWTTLTVGVRYAVNHPVIGLLILSTAFMTVFAMPYMMLLPAIADKALHGADHGKLYYSWLLAANGFGAIFGSLGVASLPTSIRRERLIPFSLMTMAALLIGFSLSRSFVLSMVLSVLSGAAFLTTNSLTNTSIQIAVPGPLRGRVMSLFVMAFMGIMPVSAAVFGPLGEVIGPTNAVLAGAIVLLAWGAYLAASGRMARGAEDARAGESA
jgi:MFS family permease